MFKIFALIVALSGTPVDILNTFQTWATKEACEEALPVLVAKLEKDLLEKYGDQIKVKETQCATENPYKLEE